MPREQAKQLEATKDDEDDAFLLNYYLAVGVATPQKPGPFSVAPKDADNSAAASSKDEPLGLTRSASQSRLAVRDRQARSLGGSNLAQCLPCNFKFATSSLENARAPSHPPRGAKESAASAIL